MGIDIWEEQHSTFWGHLEELRKVCIKILVIIALGFAVCLVFAQEIIETLITPPPYSTTNGALQTSELRIERIKNTSSKAVFFLQPKDTEIAFADTGGKKTSTPRTHLIEPQQSLYLLKNNTLIALLSPLEGIQTSLKISFWLSFAATSPAWALLLLSFFAPAIGTNSKRKTLSFLLFSFMFLSAGAFFAYCVTIPCANSFFYAFNGKLGTNIWSLAAYTEYTLMLLFANGMAFEIAFILFFLVHHGVIDADSMRTKRRYAIVLAFILATLLTPPDVPSQLMLAIPLVLFFEAALLYARFQKRPSALHQSGLA